MNIQSYFSKRSWIALVACGILQLLRGAAAQDDNMSIGLNSTANPIAQGDIMFDINAPQSLRDSDIDMIFKADNLNWGEVYLRPGQCDVFDQYCVDIPFKERDSTGSADSLVANFRNIYPHFSDAWMSKLKTDIEANYEQYKTADHVGISTMGSSLAEISVVSIGLVVDNVYGISYLDNKFTVDMKIFIHDIVQETPLTSIKRAFEEAFGGTSVVEFENDEDEDKPYVELLEDEWENVKSDPRYENAKPVKHAFCSAEYHTRMRPMKMSDYKERFGVGIQVAHSTSSPSPVEDENGNLLYVKANGVKVSFDPPNSKFFPFQSNIMDISLNFPRGREMNRVILCVDPHYTGLHLPMESIRRRDPDVPFLKMIPRITTNRAPPFLGRMYHHMKNPHLDWHHNKLSEGNKVVHSATFTLLFVPDYFDGLSVVYKFLFIIFSIELQWFVNFPDNFTPSQMITAILQLQTITSAQNNYLLYSNKLTSVIYLTYGITLAQIITIAAMAFININKDKGSLPWLVRSRGIIFRTLRLITILLAFFLIPILCVKTDMSTGQQSDYDFLYYIVGFGSIAIMIVFFLRERKNAQKLKRDVEAKERDMEAKRDLTASIMKTNEPDSSWTAPEIGQWIGTSEALREASSLTEGELEAISDKFVKAGVNGVVFPVVAYDTSTLKQDLGLTVGEAVLFVHTLEKMRNPDFNENPTTSDVESDDNELASGLQTS